MVDILVAATGQTAARIATDMDRDFILRGNRVVEYGLVDSVIERRQLADPMVAAAAAARYRGDQRSWSPWR